MIKPNQKGLCEYCGKHIIYAKGLCRKCYARDRRNGNPEYKYFIGTEKPMSEKQSNILAEYLKTNSVATTAKQFGCSKQYVYAVIHQFKKPTNADKIRAMSDEELAKLFSNWVTDCDCNDVPCRNYCSPNRLDCEKNWINWLKEQAEVSE